MNTSNSAPLGPDVCAVPRRKLFASAAAVEGFFFFFFCWKLFLLIFFPRAREFYGPSERHEDSQIVSCRSFRLLLRLRSSSRLQKNNIMFTCCERVLVVDKICKFFSLQTRSLASAESTFNCFRQPRTWRINSKCLSLGLVLIEKCFPNQ